MPFAQKKGEPPPLLRTLRLFFRTFPSVLEHIPPSNVKDQPPLTFIFENETACVFFSFEYDPEIRRPIPLGFADTGLTLAIELVRPPTFAIEAVDVAVELAQKFNLLFLIPGTLKAIAPQKEQLLSLYEKENHKAVDRARKRGEIIPFLPKDRLVYWWKYTMSMPGLQKALESASINVPEIQILRYKTTDRVVTAVPWVKMGATVFPQTDYVIVERAAPLPPNLPPAVAQAAKLKKPEIGFAPFPEVMDIVLPYAEAKSEPVPYLVYRQPWSPADVRHAVRNLRLTDPRPYKPIRPDAVVEFPPQGR